MQVREVLSNNRKALSIIWKTNPSLLIVSLMKPLFAVTDPLFFVWFFKYILDASMVPNTSIKEVIIISVLLCGMMVVKQIFLSWYKKMFLPKMETQIREKLRIRLYEELAQLDMAGYDNKDTYDAIHKAMNEIDTRVLAVLDTLANVLEYLISLGMTLYFIIYLDPLVLIYSIANLVVSTLCGMYLSKAVYNSDTAQVQEKRFLDYAHRIFYLRDHTQELRVTNLKDLVIGRLLETYRNLRSIIRKKNPRLMWLDMLSYSSNYILVGVFIVYIFFKIQTGAITVGSFAALLNGSQSFAGTLGQLFGAVPQFYQHSLYLDNLYGIFRYKNNVISGGKPVEDAFESIAFENVSFCYPGNSAYTLHNISFTLKKGETMGVVGHNGAGKSTLIKLLYRFYDPTEGRILLNGVDYKEYDLHQLRRSIGAVFQDYHAYDFSVYENVAMDVMENVDRAEVDTLLKLVGLYDVIKRESPNLSAPLSNEFEEGVILSGGQRQKLALARVLYGKVTVAVLDEPSSALDPLTEAAILDIMFKNFQNRTVLMISHRLSTTKNCGQIIHLSQGRIIESGTHQELMRRQGEYANMFTLQAESYQA